MLIRPGQSGVDPRAGVAFDNDTQPSSSSSSDTKDQRNAIGGNGIIAGQGGTVNFKIENPDGFRELLATGAGVLEAGLEFAQHQSELAYETVRESRRSEETNIGLAVLKAAGPIIMVVGIAGALIYASKG